MDKTILVVEDDPDDERLIVESLRENNVVNQIVVAGDGQDALDYLFAQGRHRGRNSRELPIVVLLDLHLPKVDGLEVLRRLRADDRTRLLPVVILTSSDEEKDRIGSYASGANSYVRKPVIFEDFVRAVRELRTYWLLLNRPPVF